MMGLRSIPLPSGGTSRRIGARIGSLSAHAQRTQGEYGDSDGIHDEITRTMIAICSNPKAAETRKRKMP